MGGAILLVGKNHSLEINMENGVDKIGKIHLNLPKKPN
jgi:hypothetical protein